MEHRRIRVDRRRRRQTDTAERGWSTIAKEKPGVAGVINFVKLLMQATASHMKKMGRRQKEYLSNQQ